MVAFQFCVAKATWGAENVNDGNPASQRNNFKFYYLEVILAQRHLCNTKQRLRKYINIHSPLETIISFVYIHHNMYF